MQGPHNAKQNKLLLLRSRPRVRFPVVSSEPGAEPSRVRKMSALLHHAVERASPAWPVCVTLQVRKFQAHQQFWTCTVLYHDEPLVCTKHLKSRSLDEEL